MRESRNKLTEKEMELARMLMSECNTTADVHRTKPRVLKKREKSGKINP